MANFKKAFKIMAVSLLASVMFLAAEEYLTSNRFHLKPASGPTADVSAIREAFHINAKIGDKMPDGTIYAGISPTMYRPMYTTPADAPLAALNNSWAYAKNLDAYGHRDWYVPSKDELNVLFNNRAAIGGFNLTGENIAGRYWSTTEEQGKSGGDGWYFSQQFNHGAQDADLQYGQHSLRCVRVAPPLAVSTMVLGR